MALSQADRGKIAYTLGVMDQPGLAMGYPDLVRMLNRIYTDKIAKLPWVPKSWLGAVGEVQAKNPADLIKVTPGYDALNRRSDMAPSFADTDGKLKAWHNIYTAQQDAIVAYAAKQAEIGASKLRALEADAAFWDGAYKLAVTVRDLPSNVVKAVGGGVSDFVGSFLPDSLKAYAKWVTAALALLIIGGVLMWYRKKVSAIIQGFKGGAA
jgi:hypothetical protein